MGPENRILKCPPIMQYSPTKWILCPIGVAIFSCKVVFLVSTMMNVFFAQNRIVISHNNYYIQVRHVLNGRGYA